MLEVAGLGGTGCWLKNRYAKLLLIHPLNFVVKASGYATKDAIVRNGTISE